MASAPPSALAKSVLAWLQAPATTAAVPDDAKRTELSKAASALASAFDLDPAAPSPAGPGLAQIYDIFLRTQSKLAGAATGAAAGATATAAAPSAPSATPTASSSAAGASSSSAAPAPTKTISEAEKAKAEQLKVDGNKAMTAKDYGGAIAAYNEAIEIDPSNPVYYSNRAAAFSQLQQHDKAIEDSTKAKDLDPTFARAYSRLGHALFSAGRYQEAVDAYEGGLAIDPANAVMKNGLEASRKQVAPSSSSSSSTAGPSGSSPASDPVARDAGIPGAGPGGLGGFPGFGDGAPGGGGMPDLGALLNNPQLMQMAQSMMANGGLDQLLNNPMLRNLMSDPNMQQMARNLMSGGGRGAGGAGGAGGSSNMYS